MEQDSKCVRQRITKYAARISALSVIVAEGAGLGANPAFTVRKPHPEVFMTLRRFAATYLKPHFAAAKSRCQSGW